ncbi:uncharacterized protein LOC128554672 [Mercenaria mercenaria]|uniref:uncharacterized protein LOC128554672 n=1 Tax=Mercenaria mercenaria TaxID=6596 RepID=UPI00234ED418|nr:uncharacterized protein LOC128554672 [Mercenaria mercenaria]
MKYFTGLTYVQFMALFSFLGDSVNDLKYWSSKTPTKSTIKEKRKIPPVEQLFITLVRLRRRFGLETMSHLLGVSESYISTIFCTWIQFMYNHFNELRHQMFPYRHHFTHFMLKVFKTFKNIRCSIDCTEFFVQMPRDFGRQGNMYSSYKHHHTYKYLIATAPNGAIVYVSNPFEGSISDRNIVEKSGFLNFLNPGDLILADRGFTIEDMLMSRQVSLNIPPFLGKRTHLTPRENVKTRRIARARIHVERVIERVKKFQLISGIIPLSLSPMLNQLVFVCSCLVNFQKPIVT